MTPTTLETAKTLPKRKSKDKEPTKHIFRALTSQLANDHPEEDMEESDEQDSGPEQPLSFWKSMSLYIYCSIFNFVLLLLYVIFVSLGRLLGRRRARPKGRPIRVLRMTTMVAQGGVAKVCLQTVLKTPVERVQTTLLVFGPKQPIPASLQARPDIQVIARKLAIWPGQYNLKLFRHLIKLTRIILRVKPDLIHLHEPQFAATVRIAAALAGGCPITVHLHNDYRVRQRRGRPIQRFLQCHALRQSYLIACSLTIFQAGEGWLNPTRYPITLIEDGSDDLPDCPPDEQLSADLTRATGGRKILAKMAHLVPHKRIEDFMMACRILQDEGYPVFALLMCYGKDKKAVELRERFNRMFAPEEGEFLFKVHAPQHLLSQVDIGITTSALEGLGLNVLEYQIQGVPVVCSDLFPHREMVTDGENGLLFETANVAELVRVLRRVLGDPALASRLGEAGRETALARKWTNTGTNTAAYYEKIMSA